MSELVPAYLSTFIERGHSRLVASLGMNCPLALLHRQRLLSRLPLLLARLFRALARA